LHLQYAFFDDCVALPKGMIDHNSIKEGVKLNFFAEVNGFLMNLLRSYWVGQPNPHSDHGAQACVDFLEKVTSE
jgi:hypothetical protein